MLSRRFRGVLGRMCANAQMGVVEKRSSSPSYIQEDPDTLSPEKAVCVAKLPIEGPFRGLNFALIHFLAPNLKYPGDCIARDLFRGMPSVGPVPASGAFRKRVREPAISPGEWRVVLDGRSRAVIARVARRSGPELGRL